MSISNLRLLDSINRPKDLIDRAVELGLAGISITEHESLSSHIDANIYQETIQKEHPDFKVALGNEIYLCDNREKGQRYYHFILIAKNEIGHKALRELSSIAWNNSFFDRGMQRVITTKDDLTQIVNKYPNSLIATTACLGGEVSVFTKNIIDAEKVGDLQTKEEAHEKIVNFILFCKELFKDDFYLECAPSRSDDQLKVNHRFPAIAKAFDLKMVIGTDAHYLKHEDRYVHKAYLNSKGGEREVDIFYEYAYLQTEEEIQTHLEKTGLDYETMVKNSQEIYSKIENYSLRKKQQIPHVLVKDYPKRKPYNETLPILNSLLDSDDIQERYWINECLNTLEDMPIPENSHFSNYLKRLEIEADVIKYISEQLGESLFPYFNTMKHYIDIIWEEESIVGPGRGSATGFLSNYLLGITQLDPIQWDLPYWRFLNKERAELPDIDIDLSPSKRPRILQRIKDERGGDFGLTLIATFGTEGTRSTILTACFKEGTLVQTNLGEKPIEKISSEDFVLTTNGFEQVLSPTKHSGRNMVTIKTKNNSNQSLECTSDHEFLVVSKENKKRIIGVSDKEQIKNLFPEFQSLSSLDKNYQKAYNYCRQVNPQWKSAKDITSSDFGLIKVDTSIDLASHIKWENEFLKDFGIGISSSIALNEDFCELIGIWLAEGSSNGAQITFTIHKEERFLRNRIIELMWNVFSLDNFSIYERNDSQTINISYASKQLINFMSQLFEVNNIKEITQWNKSIPKKLLRINPSVQLQIFKGWFLGDGYARNKTAQQNYESKGTSVSKSLINDMVYILNRNYLNPYVSKESREGKACVYNINLYSHKAEKLYKMKYESNLKERLEFSLEDRGSLDIPIFYNNTPYLRAILEVQENTGIPETVYCLQVPSQNFTVNGVIVHNCRGYRSEEFPDGIDIDTAQYMSSLVPSERGFLWPLHDVIKGNPDKDRRPIRPFIVEVEQFPGLLDIMLGIEGLINKRSSHAAGVIMFDDDPFERACFMKTPNGELITQWDLHQCEDAGMTKYDYLVTEISDKIIQTLKLLQEYGEMEKAELRELYNKYLHPSVINIKDKEIWKALGNGSVLDTFQFSTDVGLMAAKKLKPSTPVEMADANALMRLMAERGAEAPIDKYARFKKNPRLWYAEMQTYKLTDEQIAAVKPYYSKSYGLPPLQEDLMMILMDKDIAGFSLAEANDARKIVAKKQMTRIPELKEKMYERMASTQFANYVWDTAIYPQLG